MKRRTFVSAVGSAVLAGCSQSADEPSKRTRTTKQAKTTARSSTTTTVKTGRAIIPDSAMTTSTTSRTTTTESTTTEKPETLGFVFPQNGTLLEKHNFLLTVSPFSTEATTAEPASIFVSITNLADEKRRFYTGYRRAFGDVRSEETDPGYVLLDRFDVSDLVGNRCWRPT